MSDVVMILCIVGLSFQMGMLFESIRSTRRYLEDHSA